MYAGDILTSIAVLFLAAAVWDDMRRGGRLTVAGRTWLMVAGLLALVSLLLKIFVG